MFRTVAMVCCLSLLLATAMAPGRLTAQCSFDWTPHYEKVTRLTNDVAGNDSRSVPTWLSLSGSSNNLRESWYFPLESDSDTGPLYRLVNGSTGAHADDPNTLAGYSSEFVHGYPWTSRVRDGLTPMRRYLNTSTGDFRTWLFGETPSGYVANETWWASGVSPRLGYERFGTVLTFPAILSEVYDTYVLENAFLKVEANKAWGNAVGRITHKASGRQLVSEGIGDMVQSVMRFSTGEGCILANPTQSGSTDCANYGETRHWAGSPVISASITGSDPYTLTSEVRPFEFCNRADVPSAQWPDTDAAEPMLWNGQIERKETLGCKLGQVTRRDVIESEARFKLANHHPYSSQSMSVYNTHWLKIETWGNANNEDFTVEWVNLDTGATEPIDYTLSDGSVDWNNYHEKRNVNYPLGVKVTRNDGTFAFAIARLDPPSVSNDVTRVDLRCADVYQPDCTGNQILIVQVIRQGETVTKSYGDTLESFLIINGPDYVDDRLAILPSDGGNCLY